MRYDDEKEMLEEEEEQHAHESQKVSWQSDTKRSDADQWPCAVASVLVSSCRCFVLCRFRQS